eukprot:TRINITY_DN1476_c0_g1_i1.p1 TRINITY_DN1476_c0_g1~~TRINITY_DN1476_c0_g1_i1.p1  ORF type:complete len:443 (-),score=123.54 TRINITY_DN1476_c0_g1_i1:122-1450(-)
MSIFSLFDDPWSDPYQSQSYRQRALQAQRERQQQQELERRRRAKLAEQERQRRMAEYYEALEAARQQELLEQKRREQLQRRQQELRRQRKQQQQQQQQQQAAAAAPGSASDSDDYEDAADDVFVGVEPLASLFGPAFQSGRGRPLKRTSKGKKGSKKSKGKSKSKSPEPQSARIPVSDACEQGAEPMAVEPSAQTPRPAPSMSPEDAALLLQRVYRGYQVRQQDIINKLRALDVISQRVDEIVATRDNEGHTMQNAIRFDEELTQQLLKVDGVMSGQSLLVRERRRALVRRIEKELQAIDDEKESLSHSDSESQHAPQVAQEATPVPEPASQAQAASECDATLDEQSEDSCSSSGAMTLESASQEGVASASSEDGDYEMVTAEREEETGEQGEGEGVDGEGTWDQDQMRAIVEENKQLKRRISVLEQQLSEMSRVAKRRPSV